MKLALAIAGMKFRIKKRGAESFVTCCAVCQQLSMFFSV
jgi:hypothetical protein